MREVALAHPEHPWFADEAHLKPDRPRPGRGSSVTAPDAVLLLA
ncbi:nitric oxide synthase oxygenase [Micromonospora purpureochromogenes]|uniref:Transposase n=1 Tax=Micromonospora purpureochromogenes TaxID=47872 RepID=A0ABX2RJ15_9ACTN|nr:nitric oxide synthase oxygenase [Micromonospora purpureochromogenes]NYF55119.1 hypothetical protein [Micromonospora purpureochromogenes]